MGAPKHLLKKDGKTWLGRTMKLLEGLCESVVISGAGEIPNEVPSYTRLADAPDAKGPISGVLSAMRWAPGASWIIAACDLPDLSAEALDWLVSTRAPGIWATLPKLEDSCGLEPLLAYYDFRAGALLERLVLDGNFQPAAISSHPKVISPVVPPHLAPAWRNVNVAPS